jgi:hypothetical protein
MRRTLVLLCAVLILAGCANGTTNPTGAPGPDALPSGSPSVESSPSILPPSIPATTPPMSPPASGCSGAVQTGTLVLSDKDNGRQLCLATGTHLEVYLQGTASDPWTDPAPGSDVLRPEVSGKRALMIGVAAGFFVAAHPGRTTVTASRDAAHFVITVSVS